MRAYLPALFLLAGFSAPHGGCNCEHMDSGAHSGSAAHASWSNVHFPIASTGGHGVSAAVALPAPGIQHHFGHAFAAGIRQALAVGVDVIEAALGLAPSPGDGPTSEAPAGGGACQSAEDCGDGELGHGTVCDHWTAEPRSRGICREACRNDADCPASLVCRFGLDPDDASWGGCAE